jgi:hypothetical protein
MGFNADRLFRAEPGLDVAATTWEQVNAGCRNN